MRRGVKHIVYAGVDMSDIECRECGLSVRPYKQLLQQESDLCESCCITVLGEEEFPDSVDYDAD